jgi:hypothetical protein
LPAGWKDRLVEIRNENTRGAKGLCLEIHDLLIAKLIAGREKDLAFLQEAARNRMADRGELLRLLGSAAVAAEVREKAHATIERVFRGGRS